MPAPFDVETLGNGASLAAVDPAGNLTVAGSATIGTALRLAKQTRAPVQVPGLLQLYTLDGLSVSMIGGDGTAGGAILPAWSNPVVGAGPVTVTGVTAKTPLGTGITVPAGSLAASQAYHLRAWGTVTTTVDTQTVTFELDYGSTQLLSFGAQTPNSGAPVTGAAWMLEISVDALSATAVTAGGWDGLNFFFSAVNQAASVAVTSSTAKAFSLQVTPSDIAVSVTMNGFLFRRTA